MFFFFFVLLIEASVKQTDKEEEVCRGAGGPAVWWGFEGHRQSQEDQCEHSERTCNTAVCGERTHRHTHTHTLNISSEKSCIRISQLADMFIRYWYWYTLTSQYILVLWSTGCLKIQKPIGNIVYVVLYLLFKDLLKTIYFSLQKNGINVGWKGRDGASFTSRLVTFTGPLLSVHPVVPVN